MSYIDRAVLKSLSQLRKEKMSKETIVKADVHSAVTQFGFAYGNAVVERLMSDKKKGWVLIGIKSSKKNIQIYITKTGKIRVVTCNGKEWAEAK